MADYGIEEVKISYIRPLYPRESLWKENKIKCSVQMSLALNYL